MNYLIVVAHPDDEALGAGATIVKLLENQHHVAVCVLSSKCRTRYDLASDALLTDMRKSHSILGITDVYIGNYSCLGFHFAPHEEMVQLIEHAIVSSKADVVFTHHPADINPDHSVAAKACQEAARLYQRQLASKPNRLTNMLYMEIASSTDWAFPGGVPMFTPNTYVEINDNQLTKKIDSLAVYNDVLRLPPHPRAIQSLEAGATMRGSQCGYLYAEAFQSAMRLEVS